MTLDRKDQPLAVGHRVQVTGDKHWWPVTGRILAIEGGIRVRVLVDKEAQYVNGIFVSAAHPGYCIEGCNWDASKLERLPQMVCAECQNPSAADDYLCERCRLDVEG